MVAYEILDRFEKGQADVDPMVIMLWLETGNWEKLHEVTPDALSFIKDILEQASLNFTRYHPSSHNQKATDYFYKLVTGYRPMARKINRWQLPLIQLALECRYSQIDVVKAIRTIYAGEDDRVRTAFNVAAEDVGLEPIFD